MCLLNLPTFIDKVRKYIAEAPPQFDSETTLARHAAAAYAVATDSLGLSSEPMLSTEGFMWSYSSTQGIWSRIELDHLITLAQLYDGTSLPATGDKKPKRINIGWQKANNISRSVHRLHELQAPGFFDDPTPGVAFTNGFATVDDYGVELADLDSEYRATFAYDFDLDEDGEPATKWLAFLDSLWADDKDKQSKIHVLQEFIGASIANIVTDYQKCLLLIGTGSNGKSVLTDIIGELLFPEGTTTYVSPRRWDRDYSLASLKNSRINLVSELPETTVLEQTDVFKQVVVGDLVEARLPYQPPFFVRPRAGHVFSANEIPRTRDNSHGFFRRFLILMFNKNFDESPFRRTKEEIKIELAPERSRIILWALNGAARLIRNGAYTKVASHETAVKSWKMTSDAVYDFAFTCLDYPDNDGTTTIDELREAYKQWARKVGRCEEIGVRTLSMRLAKIDELHKRHTSSGGRWNCGIKLIKDWKEIQH